MNWFEFQKVFFYVECLYANLLLLLLCYCCNSTVFRFLTIRITFFFHEIRVGQRLDEGWRGLLDLCACYKRDWTCICFSHVLVKLYSCSLVTACNWAYLGLDCFWRNILEIHLCCQLICAFFICTMLHVGRQFLWETTHLCLHLVQEDFFNQSLISLHYCPTTDEMWIGFAGGTEWSGQYFPQISSYSYSGHL